MKPALLLYVVCLAFAIDLPAQPSLADSVRMRQARVTKTSSLILSGWGAASLGSGWIASTQTSGAAYHFHKTNAIFGGVNLLLGQLGFWSSRKMPRGNQNIATLFRGQERIEKLFLFNTALDLVYVGLGGALVDKGNNRAGPDRDRLRGTGYGLILQGSFLLLFDGVLYLLHNRNGNRLNAYLDKLTIGPTPYGPGLVYRF